MCVCLQIHNKYTQYTHIYYANKYFYFGHDSSQLIVLQHKFVYISKLNVFL